MVQPHDYQQECLQAIAQTKRAGRKKALVVMASGLGKTITAALDVKRYHKQHGGKALFLCHQNDILEQSQKEFARVLGWKKDSRYAFFHGYDKRRAHEADVVFASFQTMREWRTTFDKEAFKYIVVDESHHGPAPTYRPTLEYFTPEFLLAITATPDRMDLQDIREIYGLEVFDLPLAEALARGLLTKVDYQLVTDEITNLKEIVTTISKMSVKQLNRSLFIPKRDEEIVQIISRHVQRIKNPKVMIFCQTTAHCDRLAKIIPNALAIHYRLSVNEQRKRLQAFREGEASYVLTVDRFNEGIDIPHANVIVFLRSTASETIFLQQLGRGLRKFKGKHRVTVLDFVANCERLEMVNKLWQKVIYHHIKLGGISHKPAFEIEVGRMGFSAVVQDVLRILQQIRSGYTKEMLIGQLKRLAETLERAPMQEDLAMAAKLGTCASVETFRKYFGAFNAALEAAGIPVTFGKRIPEKEYADMIDQLQKLAAKIGHTPRKTDLAEAAKGGECSSPHAYLKKFGSLNAALKAAGLPLRMKQTSRKGCVHKFVKKGKNSIQFEKPLRAGKKPTKDEMISELKKIATTLGRKPAQDDVTAAAQQNACMGIGTYRRRFGSWEAALARAGLKQAQRGPKKATDSAQKEYKRKLLRELQELAIRLRHTPTHKEVQAACKRKECSHPLTFRRHFGSIQKAQRKAGLKLNQRGRKKKPK